MTDISSITQPIQLKPRLFERLDLNYIFIFKVLNHILTEITRDTNGRQGNSEKAEHKLVAIILKKSGIQKAART